MGLASCQEVCFVDVFVHWLFAKKPLLAFIDVDKLLKGRAPDYTNDVLARGSRYKHIFSNSLWLSIGVEELRALMAKHAAAVREQHQLSQISDGTELHAPLDEFELITLATQLRLPVAFAITPVRSLRCYSEAI